MGVLEEVAGELAVEGDLLALCNPCLKDEPGDEDRGEYGSDDTDDQGCSESLDRTGTEYEQHDTGEEGCDLTVDDCGISVLVTVLDCKTDSLAGLKLFLDTLVDNNVCVHGHTQGKYQTCDTRQCEHCSECCQRTEQENHVGKEGDICSHTCASVEEDHKQEHKDEGDDEGDESGTD